MTDDISPADVAAQDQARAMALQCAPILLAAYQIAEQATDTEQSRKLLMDQCVRDQWSALEAMALAIEMMRRTLAAEREHAKLRAAITAEQTAGALERQAVVDAAKAWFASRGNVTETAALMDAIEALSS